jgi:rhodanese-related sulfurtransferase
VRINISKLLSITFISILISLFYNHFNPNGLKLIRDDRVLSWESDPLSGLETSDSLTVEKNITTANSSDSLLIEKKDEQIKSFTEPKAIKLNFAYKLFNEVIQFIDSRSTEEFAEGHIKGSVNIPFYGSENYLDVINGLDKNEIVVTYCSGADCDISILSGEELFEMGFKRVYVFIDGYDEWIKNNYPINKN